MRREREDERRKFCPTRILKHKLLFNLIIPKPPQARNTVQGKRPDEVLEIYRWLNANS